MVSIPYLRDFDTRSQAPTFEADNDEVELEKSNVLMIGPTGSGILTLILFFFLVSPFFAGGGGLYPSFLMFFGLLSDCETGKTLLAKTLARLVNVPFVVVDATALTQAKFLFSFLTF